ncbi:MAG: Hsp20/alpha crystallin family protein [Gemmataceae bacterium]
MNDTLVKTNGTKPETPTAPTQRRVVYTPHVDILELPEELVLYLDVPGVRSEDVEIDFERGELTVRARRLPRPEGGTRLMQEFVVGDYYRAFLISQDIAADRISAELKHGVLTVHLPRADAAQPRKIAVKSV